jgi:hypothetical protein
VSTVLDPPGPPGVGGAAPHPGQPPSVGPPPGRAPAAAPTSGPRPGALPTSGEWWDFGMLVLAGTVAVSAFGPAFGGWWYLLVGAVGLCVGGIVALVGARRSWHPVVVALVALVAYLVVGGPFVVPDRTVAVVVPSPSSVLALLEGAIRGWDNVLTTEPLIGRTSGLVVIVWVGALVCGTVAVSVARRAGSAGVAAALGPALLLAAGIWVGTDATGWPTETGVEAVALVALLAVWASVRQRTLRSAGVVAGSGARWIGGIAMLVVAGCLGLLLGSWGPVAGGRERSVARTTAQPPVEEIDLASPLEGFRRYRTGSLAGEILFTVDDMRAGERIRLVTLDRFDGESWRVEPSGNSGGSFKRVGEQIESSIDPAADRRAVRLRLGAYDGPWVPTLYGTPLDIDYDGPDRADLDEGLRYNATTETAAQTDGARTRSAYRLEVAVRPTHRSVDGDPRTPEEEVPEGEPGAATVPDAVAVPALALVQAQFVIDNKQESRLAQLLEVARRFGGEPTELPGLGDRRGYLSDGADVPGHRPSDAGHSARRLSDMFDVGVNRNVLGNAEQFASALALVARQLGFPSRVVMGFAPDAPSVGGAVDVRGADVTAWTEVNVDGVGWIPVFGADPTDTNPPEETDPPQRIPPDRLILPPPPPPSTTLPGRNDAAPNPCAVPDPPEECPDPAAGPLIPAWVRTVARFTLPPILLVGGVTGLMGGLKARRRKRRRSTGSPDARIAAGWTEVTDLARDMGDVVPDRSTRRETAVILARPGIADLARTADGLVFGPSPLDEASAERYWQQVDVTRAAMLASTGRFDRWKAVLNPSSLRRSTERPLDAAIDPARWWDLARRRLLAVEPAGGPAS